MKKHLVIAIDGPAGAGKSTMSEALSKRLNIPYFSTGSMYRALALKCARLHLDPTSAETADFIAKSTHLDLLFKNGKQSVVLDGEDVSNLLYNDEISLYASQISTHKIIRQKMVEIQRQVANEQSLVMDGRDIGSVVLPMANFKFYLDADVNVRAQRRYDQLVLNGSKISYEEVLQDMKNRDIRDKTREISPLVVAKDAIVVDCTNLTVDEAVDKFMKFIGEWLWWDGLVIGQVWFCFGYM